MVVAVKNAWSGAKVAGVPNFQPMFWASSNVLAQDYASLIQQRPGQYHIWVHAVCQAIIQPFIDLPVVLFDKKNEEKLIEEHPVLDLMRKPNPYMTGGTSFYEAILWDLLLTTIRTPGGQAFIVGEKPTNFRKGEVPQELWVFDDTCMTPRLDRSNVLIGWTLGVGSSQMELDLDHVIRINLFNKYDWKLGLSPLASALIQVNQDAKANEFNTRFLDNNAAPSGMVSLEGAPPDKAIWEALRKEFTEKYAGHHNAGKTLFMPWMLKFEQFSRSHLDFAYMEQLGWNRDAILAAFRVNKWSVGVTEDLNYATAKEAKRQLLENAVLPLARVVFTALNESWIRFIDKRTLRIKVDLSKVPALQEDRSQKVKDAQGLVQMNIPTATALEYVGIDIDTKGMPWLSENPDPFANMDATAEPFGKKPPKPATDAPAKSLVLITKDERDNLSKAYIEKLFLPGERELLPVVTRFFVSQRNAMQDLADEILKGTDTPSSLSAQKFLLAKREQDAKLVKDFQPLFMNQVRRTIRGLRGELKSLNLDSTEDQIREFLKSRLLSLSEINTTTFDGVEEELAKTISDGIDSHLTMDEMAKAIQESIRQVYQGRINTSKTIARTETAGVTSGVRFEVFRSSGINKQEWLSARDKNVRKTHAEEDGNIVPVGDPFPVTHLHYPNDEAGPADEVINCRCICLAVEEE